MDQQVRDFLTHCSAADTPTPSGHPQPSTSCLGNRILSRNANGTIAMTSQPTNESELQLYRVLQRANLLSYYDTFICQGGDDVQQLCEAGEEEFLEIMALVGMASKPLHVRRLQKALQEWVNNPAMFQTPLVPAVPPTHPNYPVNHMSSRPSSVTQSPLSMRPSPPMPMVSNNSQSSPSPGSKDVPSPSQIHQQREHQLPHLQQGGGEYGQPSSPLSLTPVLVESQIQRLSEAAEFLVQSLPSFEPKPQNNKKKICKDLEYVMNMADDDPRRMDEIRKYAAIYGRFDCKRKPEKPLTLHEVSVNEAAAQICKHIPALLTRRDELFPLARQVVRDSGYQYSKGHSRSQCYTKTCDEELCKRARLDPNLAHDKSHVEEVKKRRQERIEAIGEQLKSLGTQQEELKTCLQQAREVQNFNAVNQIQTQLEQVATQQMQLISEQSEINKQLRRIDRYFLGKNYNVRSSCSEAEKIDTDDTDSQFSIYSNASSPTLSHDAHDSPSRDSNQSSQASDMYNTMKMVSGKKANSQITKQLVQETLMDEGLRVVKELASQIREDTEIPISISKPEGRPRGRPPRLERDYLVSTAGATGGVPITSLSTAISLTSSTSPLASAQNGHCLITMNGPSDNYSASRPNGMMLNNSGLHNSNDANDKTDSSEIGKSPENSLNALLALSQKGVKQEPPSPNSTGKME
ncbi:NGFI-A-binding protein 1-like isoform X1 [Centruroides vittatus]|uniref:NGFI-A-binding protein 1-like isoform X1 n=2 Tax=Centruroides vittatus TaxID=120091 RepID=UPI0035105C66